MFKGRRRHKNHRASLSNPHQREDLDSTDLARIALFALLVNRSIQTRVRRPSGKVVSDADCCAVGRKSSREVGGRGREVGGPCIPPDVLLQNWGGIQPNRTVTCTVLKATANDRRHLALCHDEFRGPRSVLYRSGGISNTNRLESMTR
ncbi:uncharacterized protein TNCV_878541 [Trichonephila clavipes]|nr:uncharacterized protein TNCV_878541 [Trichonephila clavipes]